MNQENIQKSVQYKFDNVDRYGKSGKSRNFKQISDNAEPANLLAVGKALATLQGDEFAGAYLISKEPINEQ